MEDKKSVNPRIVAVIGPTASGKSELAVQIAKAVDGEIISADSRQIYSGLNIGSGKVDGKWKNVGGRGGQHKFIYKNIPHYLIDEASPRRQYSVARFQRDAKKIIKDILSRGKMPIICGGTAQWVDAVVYDHALPVVKPDAKLRAQIEKLTVAQMFAKLKKLDPQRAADIDAQNPRRLIRALEIVMSTGKPVPKLQTEQKYNTIWLGIKPDAETLDKKIKLRLKARLKQGMIKEVKKLHAQGISWKRLESFGLEYKFCALFLQNTLNKDEMETQLATAIRQYAKRQMTWWKRNSNIYWESEPKKLLALAKNGNK